MNGQRVVDQLAQDQLAVHGAPDEFRNPRISKHPQIGIRRSAVLMHRPVHPSVR